MVMHLAATVGINNSAAKRERWDQLLLATGVKCSPVINQTGINTGQDGARKYTLPSRPLRRLLQILERFPYEDAFSDQPGLAQNLRAIGYLFYHTMEGIQRRDTSEAFAAVSEWCEVYSCGVQLLSLCSAHSYAARPHWRLWQCWKIAPSFTFTAWQCTWRPC